MQTALIAVLLLLARSITALVPLHSHRLAGLRGCKLHSKVSSCSVGIDLGTTYSLLSIPGSSGVRIIPIDGASTVPSIVTYRSNRTPLVGSAAEQHAVLHPSKTFASMKRVIGKSQEEVLKLKDKYFTAKLAAVPGDRTTSPRYTVGDGGSKSHTVTAEEVAAEIIKKLVSAAETHLNQAKIGHNESSENTVKVDKAVITVPAYFNQAQRDATERAGKLAGLQKVKLLKEPEAAALAYGLNLQKPQLVLVFDLGGGTLDVSVLEVGNGFVEVIATTGDTYLGGDDFDAVIVSWLLKQWAGQEGVTPAVLAHVREDAAVMARLREAAQQAKRALSAKAEVSIQVPQLHAASGLDLKPVLLTRRGFESLSRPLLLRMLQPLREVAVMAGVNLPGESGQVGYTTEEGEEENDALYEKEREAAAGGDGQDRLPSVAALRREQVSGRAAARQRQKLMGSTQKELHRLQRSSGGGGGGGASAGVGAGGGRLELFPAGRALDTVLLVGGATRMPCVRDAARVITGLTPLPHSVVHPDEAVCLGAGTLAGMLDGVIPDMQVVSHWQSAMLRFLQEEKNKGNDLLGRNFSV